MGSANVCKRGEFIPHGKIHSALYGPADMHGLSQRMPGLDFDFTLRRDIPPPAVIFDEPRVAELMGAGFQKLPGSNVGLSFWLWSCCFAADA